MYGPSYKSLIFNLVTWTRYSLQQLAAVRGFRVL
uniref:Uncharacterized protein n=1 Tax=Anguilla anguilla TaxID=7936 RepID=A0A0E9PCS5_ANGAN